jgi:hypothetical protein
VAPDADLARIEPALKRAALGLRTRRTALGRMHLAQPNALVPAPDGIAVDRAAIGAGVRGNARAERSRRKKCP